MDYINSPFNYKQLSSSKKGSKHLNIPNFKRKQKKPKDLLKTAFQDVEKIDNKLSLIWDLWSYRIGKILIPNCVSHIKSLISLIFYVMQMIIILETIHKKHGHIGNIPAIEVTLFPVYGVLILRLILQTSTLIWTIHNALYIENKLHFVKHFEELNRFLPVFEQCIPVITYLLMLITSMSIGFCHLNKYNNSSDFCQVFRIQVVETIISLYVICQSIHHLIAIYHNKRHTSLPQRKFNSNVINNNNDNNDNKNSVLDKLEDLNEDLTSSWQWWKYRMDRIFCAHLSHNICNLCDVILEGTTVLFLVRAIHDSQGYMGNITNMPNLLIPLYIKFFGKAFIQFATVLYVSFIMFSKENALKFLKHLNEPGKYKKTIEHLIPVISYVIIGFVTMSIGQCHLNPDLNKGQKICKIFSFSLVESFIIAMAAIQFIHHILSIYHYRRHSKEPRRSDKNDIIQDTIEMDRTDQTVF